MEQTHAQEKNTIEWRVWPASMQPRRCIFAWAIIAISGALIMSTDLIIGILLTVLFIGSLSTFLFPSRFRIDQEGLTAMYPIRKKYYKWSQVRRAKFFNDACYLFTRKKPSNLDGWSGIAVYYGNRKDEIAALLKAHLQEGVVS